MFKKINLWRGLLLTFSVLLMLSIAAGSSLESHRGEIDTQLGTVSSRIVTQKPACPDCKEETYDAVCPKCGAVIPGADSVWNFIQEWDTAKKMYEGLKEISIRMAQESIVLLKNEMSGGTSTLPIARNAKITLLGIRSYAPVYGAGTASSTDGKSTEGNEIFNAFAARGFQINPSMLAAYASYFTGKNWSTHRFTGTVSPFYTDITSYTNIPEFSPDELAQLNPDYKSEFSSYNDAAIVVVGRPSAESSAYYPGAAGLIPVDTDYIRGMTGTTTGNILGLSNEEMEIIELAKANFNKVIVLINAANPMEYHNLKNDPGIDAILWIGEPGSYGFYAVADVLNGTINPSGHLGNTVAANTAAAPAMMNFGDSTAWDVSEANYGSVAGLNIHYYQIQAESIYAGYYYYETRYADSVTGKQHAKNAKAGSWTQSDLKPGVSSGTWIYNNEVTYPFGFGGSYTTFEQTLNSVAVMGNRKTANVSVTVTNTGNVSGKDVVQFYAQSPYTQYDIDNKIEKPAVRLLDYEKTRQLAPGQSQTIVMEVDLANLASYDYLNAKTYILTPGDYYFAIGDNAHDALNNILTAQGYSVSDGMTYAGNANKTSVWTIEGSVIDDKTFAVSKAGVEVTNQLSGDDDPNDRIFAMDFNAFRPGTVTYLTRNDWNGTWPKTYSGLKPTEEMRGVMLNDFIPVKINDNVSNIIFNDTGVTLTFNDMKGASYDDPRWELLLNKLDAQEFLNFAARSFHNVENIDSVGLLKYFYDDGPIGSDSRHLGQATYRRQPFVDAEEFAGFYTRVSPCPTNIAYMWNKELAYENGQKVLGEVFMAIQSPFVCGPGANIHRHAYNARGHEYYSEDPVLSGFTGSAVSQGAQSKGAIVQIKHYAFNCQEIQRDGIAVFMSEQKARELELRNFQQIFEGNGMPVSFKGTVNEYSGGALGTMLSYNRIGAVAAGANKAAVQDILRGEWGFRGYSVTDFSSVAIKAAPKEAIYYGTTAFCGSSVNANVTNHPSYVGRNGSGWTIGTFAGDSAYLFAIKQATHYNLYALAQSNALNGIFASSYMENLMTWWRAAYIAMISVFGIFTLLCAAFYVIGKISFIKGKGAV